MSLRSLLNSKSLAFLFSICFLISLYANLEQWSRRTGLRDTEQAARIELDREKHLKESLQKEVDRFKPRIGELPVRQMDEELVSLVLLLKSSLPARMMTISTISVSRSTTAQQGTSIASLAAPLKKSEGLKVLGLKISGTYQNLQQFEDYLAAIKEHPVILSGLTLDRTAFTLQLHLIGK